MQLALGFKANVQTVGSVWQRAARPSAKLQIRTERVSRGSRRSAHTVLFYTRVQRGNR